jgi:hypothetical protein
MDRFWRTVSIAMGALLAAGCPVRTKYGIETGGDTGEADFAAEVAAPIEGQATPLPSSEPQLPRVEPVIE